MVKKRLAWIRCDSIETERRVREVWFEAQESGFIPDDLCVVFSYGDEIKFEDPMAFLEQLESLTQAMRRIVGGRDLAA